jgi:hypothetical protein
MRLRHSPDVAVKKERSFFKRELTACLNGSASGSPVCLGVAALVEFICFLARGTDFSEEAH